MLPCCMNSTLLPDSFPQPHASLSFLLSAQHSPRFSPFVFNRFQTLSFSVSCNPFICHSYENCRVCTNNSHSGTQSSASAKIVVLSFHALTNCPLFPRVKQSLYFHALTNCPFRKPFLLTFIHRMGGVPPSAAACEPAGTRLPSPVFCFLHSSFCLLPSALPLPPCYNLSELGWGVYPPPPQLANRRERVSRAPFSAFCILVSAFYLLLCPSPLATIFPCLHPIPLRIANFSPPPPIRARVSRSEEHTSELQSLAY